MSTPQSHEAFSRLAQGIDDGLAALGVSATEKRPEPPSRGEAFVQKAARKRAEAEGHADGLIGRLEELNDHHRQSRHH